MTKRAFKIPVGERLRRRSATKSCDCSKKTKRYDEKERDYVPRKGAKR